jgi:hypothetical protein
MVTILVLFTCIGLFSLFKGIIEEKIEFLATGIVVFVCMIIGAICYNAAEQEVHAEAIKAGVGHYEAKVNDAGIAKVVFVWDSKK